MPLDEKLSSQAWAKSMIDRISVERKRRLRKKIISSAAAAVIFAAAAVLFQFDIPSSDDMALSENIDSLFLADLIDE